MGKFMLSRRDGYELRLDMMGDLLKSAPKEIFDKIMGILGANEAAVRIQRFFRGLDARLRQPSRYEREEAIYFLGERADRRPIATRVAQLAWEGYATNGSANGRDAFRKLRRQPEEVIYLNN